MAGDSNYTEDFLEVEDLQRELNKNRAQATIQTVSALVETLGEAIEKLQAKEFYDQKLAETISDSLKNVVTSLKEVVKPDLSEFVKIHEAFVASNSKNQKAILSLVSDVSHQNETIINKITTMLESPSGNSQNDDVINEVLSAIKSSNELMVSIKNQPNYATVLKKIAERPKRWKFDVVYFGSGSSKIKHILASAINEDEDNLTKQKD